MIKTVTLTFTDAQWFALTDITPDPEAWLQNAGVARARTAAYERKSDPNWSAAVLATAAAGGDISDDTAILSAGIAAGIFKDAATRQAELDTAEATAATDLSDQSPA